MYRLRIKRCLDLVCSFLLMPFFLLLLIPISIAIKIEDRGPIFYGGTRVGKDGKEFIMYKFRSMTVNAPDIRNEDGSTYNSSIDTRVTRVGRILRETSIDEVPQIINMLKGDMSLIGPRPGLPDLLSSYSQDEISKLRVRPGITGYTQAYYRNDITNREKRLKDAWYANNVSLWLDVKILFMTILTVLKRKGLYTNDGISKDINQK
ncbi:sugar transferase [Sporosarcina pasteurii]|uniref:Colanic biosynthesis UDP-glucose lipid carrier transferase n=2 Tax=Sporosarcina pasteurii TaxID=1474 RepID=A0A380BET0_SPOPA|nr:sugar transferase [Sporosarcina pasteurii]MDS9472215.1 sugar transferase [Sporosarcina pasteurii]QBQ06201.1 sugar transferase [Sporosarcina pasteurii]SUI99188.1 Putative colanic biosynthesis UDP-glucose lipid carrier transferase [Sporosarcina pasteurii]